MGWLVMILSVALIDGAVVYSTGKLGNEGGAPVGLALYSMSAMRQAKSNVTSTSNAGPIWNHDEAQERSP